MNVTAVRKACDMQFHKPIVNLLLIQLARHAKPDNTVEMKQDDLATICGVSKPLLIESMKRLEEKGAISITRRRTTPPAKSQITTSKIKLDFAS